MEVEDSVSVPKSQQQTKSGGKQEKERKRKKKKAILSDPMKIIDSVLNSSSFKVANLSQLVEQKFYHSEEHSKQLQDSIKDVRYESVVSQNFTYDDLTVLPEGFDGKVNLGPTAIMNMTCINHVPERRQRWKKRSKSKKNSSNNSKVEGSNTAKASRDVPIREN